MSLKRLHTLFSVTGHGDEERKRELILEATEGRTSSSRELNDWEMRALLGKLQHIANSDPDAKKKDTMRKKIIGLMKEAGYTLPGNKADMQKITEWLKTTFKKPFNDYNAAELTKIIYAAEKVRDHFLSKVRTPQLIP